MPLKVLVLCHGNINRSAIVAAMLMQNSELFEVRQGGLVEHPSHKGLYDRPASKKMREAAALKDIDLSKHRARLVEEEDFSWADEVLYMDGGNLKRMQSRYGRFEDQFVCLAKYDPQGATRIPDPGFMAKTSGEFMETVHQLIRSTKMYIKTKAELLSAQE